MEGRAVKIHNHDDQLDGHFYARCGRVEADSPRIVMPHVFEATPPALRCAICDRDWFPRGQPDWHHRAAIERQLQQAKD